MNTKYKRVLKEMGEKKILLGKNGRKNMMITILQSSFQKSFLLLICFFSSTDLHAENLSAPQNFIKTYEDAEETYAFRLSPEVSVSAFVFQREGSAASIFSAEFDDCESLGKELSDPGKYLYATYLNEDRKLDLESNPIKATYKKICETRKNKYLSKSDSDLLYFESNDPKFLSSGSSFLYTGDWISPNLGKAYAIGLREVENLCSSKGGGAYVRTMSHGFDISSGLFGSTYKYKPKINFSCYKNNNKKFHMPEIVKDFKGNFPVVRGLSGFLAVVQDRSDDYDEIKNNISNFTSVAQSYCAKQSLRAAFLSIDDYRDGTTYKPDSTFLHFACF